MPFERRMSIAAALAAVSLLTACGQKENASEPMDEAPEAAMANTTEAAAPAEMPRTPSPEGARVYFVTPADGATVTNPVRIEFGIEGMSVAPAGDQTPNSGHHHLIVDAPLPDLNMPIPADENHIHFGDGSTSTELTLEPGEHTLQLLFADYRHVPHDPPVVSETITITVE